MRATISRQEAQAFIRSLGADPSDVQSVEIDPHKVTVTAFRRNERGDLVVAGDFVATTVTEIGYEREGA